MLNYFGFNLIFALCPAPADAPEKRRIVYCPVRETEPRIVRLAQRVTLTNSTYIQSNITFLFWYIMLYYPNKFDNFTHRRAQKHCAAGEK